MSRMNCWFYAIVTVVLVAGCSKPGGQATEGKPSNTTAAPAAQNRPKNAAPAWGTSGHTPPFTSVAKVKGVHGGTMVQLMPENIDAEILVDEADESVIVLGVLKGELLQDLWFASKTSEGELATEAIRGEKRTQFGISDSWIFKNGRLVEMLKQGRDGKLTLNATTQTGAQTTPEFLTVEITWPAQRPTKRSE